MAVRVYRQKGQASQKQETSQYKIEKGIPIPSKTYRRVPRYPIDEMGKGDSFLVLFNNEPRKRIRGRISQALVRQKEKDDSKFFSFRTEDEGIRVWRIK